jgi:DNA-binding MarR family transcriptional regulator
LKEIQGIKLAEVENSIGYLLRRANRMARDLTIPGLAQNGLSPIELTALYLVNENRDCTLRNLAKAVFLEPPAMHRLLNGLEKKGLISRRKSEQDARFTFTRITPLGKKKIADSIEGIRNIERDFLGKLDRNQRKNLITILKALVLE